MSVSVFPRSLQKCRLQIRPILLVRSVRSEQTRRFLERSLPKPIEEIAPGDSVRTWDEGKHRFARGAVVRTFQRHAAHVLQVVIGIGTKSQTIVSTSEHPFWVQGRGWTPAINLVSGARLLCPYGVDCVVVSVLKLDGGLTVYNFEVTVQHNYFVGESPILVHNESILPRGTERAEPEFEMSAPILQHLLQDFDIAGYERATGVKIKRMAEELARAHGKPYSREFYALAVIKSHPKPYADPSRAFQVIQPASQLKLRVNAPARVVNPLASMWWSRDGSALEVRSREDAPHYGFNSLLPTVKGLVGMFPNSSPWTTETLLPYMQFNLSKAEHDLRGVARAMNTIYGIEKVSAGQYRIFGDGVTTYQNIFYKGLVRLVHMDWIENRTLGSEVSLWGVSRPPVWIRRPPMGYADLASAMAVKRSPSGGAAVAELYNHKKDVLIDDLRYLSLDSAAAPYLDVGLYALNRTDPKVASSLAHSLQRTIYSMPTQP
jgi:hypothetical protein